MRKATVLVLLVGLMVVAIAAVAGPAAGSAASAAPALADENFLVEYPVPRANGQPRNIVVESPGRVWFTLPGANAIGRLVVTTSTNFTFTIFDVPTAASEPYDLAFDGTYIWFTEKAGNKIGRLTVANGNIVEYPVPTANSQPTGIDVAPNGKVWFVQKTGNKIASFDPTNSQFSETPYTRSGGQLEDVAVESATKIWFTAPGVNRAVQFVTTNSSFVEVVVSDFGVPPYPAATIAMGQDGAPWIAAETKDLVGRFTPGTLALWRWYQTPTAGGGTYGIAPASSGNLQYVWFTERDAGRVGLLLTRSTGQLISIVDRPLGSPNSRPLGVAVDDDGHAWIAESGSNMIAEWRPPYFFFVYLPVVIRP